MPITTRDVAAPPAGIAMGLLYTAEALETGAAQERVAYLVGA
jgi:hypothetical protein